MEFRVGAAEIQKRNKNLILGALFGGILCLITYMGYKQNSEQYNATLLLSVFIFVIIAFVINLMGHIRYLKKNKSHVLMVQDGAILFRTGADESRLEVADIQSIQRKKRWREGPSILIRLKNNRIIRLVGYEDLDTLERLLMNQIGK